MLSSLLGGSVYPDRAILTRRLPPGSPQMGLDPLTCNAAKRAEEQRMNSSVLVLTCLGPLAHQSLHFKKSQKPGFYVKFTDFN